VVILSNFHVPRESAHSAVDNSQEPPIKRPSVGGIAGWCSASGVTGSHVRQDAVDNAVVDFFVSNMLALQVSNVFQ
jgi:hypothetical protein